MISRGLVTEPGSGDAGRQAPSSKCALDRMELVLSGAVAGSPQSVGHPWTGSYSLNAGETPPVTVVTPVSAPTSRLDKEVTVLQPRPHPGQDKCPSDDAGGLSWSAWKAKALNRLFLEHGARGEPGKITAATVRHGGSTQQQTATTREKRQFFAEAISRSRAAGAARISREFNQVQFNQHLCYRCGAHWNCQERCAAYVKICQKCRGYVGRPPRGRRPGIKPTAAGAGGGTPGR